MNSRFFKLIFSKRLNALVAVGENCSSEGKSTSASLSSSIFTDFSDKNINLSARFAGMLALGFIWVASAFADPAINTLPIDGSVAQGSASIAQQANQMVINQITDKVVINWQGFDIGVAASINVLQPNSSSVLLNRVVGNNPSQIFGTLTANGHVILVNPNGIVFGADGSVTASAFTASTLGISDTDFMAGNYRFAANGTAGSILNQGSINTTNGYVALLGANVTNDGKITTNQGNVYMGAAQGITVPVSNSGRIRMELDPASVNAAVNNTQNGVIVTSGGQVLMQASAVNDAMATASITHTGQINTTAIQAGNVTLLTDGGNIRVSGNINANSTDTSRVGGDIYIGRDITTNKLAKATDVSGAILLSNKGFVETSGDWLSTYGSRVIAKDWLLDPYSITIAASSATGTAYASNFSSGTDSTILASDISANLTAGTSVTIATGPGGASAGNIAVNESIAKTGGGDATLTLQAHGNINVATGKTITSDTGKLNVVFNSDSDATGGGAIVFNTGSGITSNGGNITLGGGTVLNGTSFAIADGLNTLQGITLNTAAINAGGGNIVMNGKTAATNYQTSLSNISGIYMAGGSISTTGSGTINLTGNNQNTDTQSQGFVLSSGTITGGSTGAVTITGDSRGVTSSSYTYVRGALVSGTVTSMGGNISITGYGGAGVQYDYGVDVSGSVTTIGAGAVNITGIAGAGGSGGNVGVTTSGGGNISSVDGAITITGTGGIGNGAQIRDHGVQIGGSNAVISRGIGDITVTGTVTNNDNGFSQGVAISSGGLTTSSGNIKVDATALLNYQVAAYINAPISSSSGNIYIRSASSNIQNTAAGTITGNNVSIDNTGGTIDVNGVITKGSGGASTWSGVISQKGVDIKGTITAANNLNIYGNQTGSDTGISIGANVTARGNLNLYGVTSGGKGIDIVTGKGISGGNIQLTGKTTNGVQGILFNGSNSVTTTGTSGDSLIKGITTAGGSNALLAWGGLNLTAATGTTLSLWGDGTNTGDRAARFDGGATTTGAVTLKGTSNNATALILINGAVTANANSAVTLSGTTSGLGQSAVYFVNNGGVSLNNGATLNITGQNTNSSGVSTGVLLGGSGVAKAAGATSAGTVTITGSTSSASGSTGVSVVSGVATDGNITIQGTVASASNTGVNITSAINSYGVGDAINVSSNYNIVHSGSIGNTSGGATAIINLTSTLGSVNGSGTLVSNGVNASSGGITINTALAGTLSGVISGSGSLIKTGAGTTILTAANSYSGTTTVSAGVLQVGDGGVIGNLGAGAITDNASLVFNRSDSVTFSNTISGTGTLTQSGTGTTILTGGNSYTGTTNISAGALQIGNGGTVGSLGAGAVVNNSALLFNRSDNIIVSNAISGTGTVTQSGTGVLTFPQLGTGTVNNTYTGQTYVNAGTLSLKATSNLAQYGTGQFNIATGAILNFDVANAINTTAYTNTTFSGNGTITKTGAGQVVWNTSAGTFNLGAGSLIDVQAGTFVGSSNTNETWTNNLASLNVASGAIFTGSEGNIRVDALTGAGSVTTGWSTSGSITLGVNGTAASVYNPTAGTATFSGVISSTTNNTGVTSLSKIGIGTQILTGANTYKGITSIGAGTLQIGNGGTTGSLGTGAVTDNATLVFNRSNSLSVANTISGTGTLTQSGSGTTILTADNSYTGTTTISNGTLQVGNGGTTGSLGTGAVTDNATLVFNRSNSLSVANTISGTGTLTQSGSGTTILTADNSYTGTTTISNGTLQVGNGGTTGSLGVDAVTLSNNSNLSYVRSANTVIANNISGVGNLSASITGDLTLSSNVALAFSGTTINLLSSGSITETAGSLAATNLFMTVTTGNIGSASQKIQSSVDKLSLTTAGNAFVTEANAVTLAASVGNLDVTTTNGTLSVGAVNNITGITATGNATLSGVSATGFGIYIGNNITASSGIVSITGTTSSSVNPDAGVKSAGNVSAKNITMVASATSATGTALGYFGAGGVFNASEQLNLTGSSSNAGNGFYSYTGSFSSGTGMAITGTSASGQGVGLDNQITLSNGSVGGITVTGTAADASKQGIGLRGTTFNNAGSDTVITAVSGNIFSSSGNPIWNTGVHTNTINQNGTGAVQVSAGNSSATNSGAIDGSVLSINQNNNAGVTVSTSGTGNLIAPKIVNSGSGNVIVAAGSSISAGTGAGGQVLTINGNNITNSAGKTYIYTGQASGTGVLSYLDSSFSSLYYQGASHTLNAAFNQAYGSTITGGANAQVFFREATLPNFSLTLPAVTLTKTYGATDPIISDIRDAVQTAYAGPSELSTSVAGVGGSNTFAFGAVEAINSLSGDRTAGNDASITPYAYTLSSVLNTTLIGTQPGLRIDKTGLVASIDSITTTYGTVVPLTAQFSGFAYSENAAGVGISLAGLTSAGYTGNTTTNNVGGYAITAASLANQNSTANYYIDSISNGTLTITPATINVIANNASKLVTQSNPALTYSYSGLVNGDSISVLSAPTLSRLPGETAGTYAISAAGANAGSNYTVQYTPGVFTIAGVQKVLIQMSNVSTVYGTTVNPSIQSVEYINNSSVIFTLSRVANTNTWTDGVGGLITITPTLATATTNAGIYQNVVTNTNNGTATSSGNFNGVMTQTANVTIAPKVASINIADVNRTYDGSAFTALQASASTSDLVNGDTIASLGGLSYLGSAIGSTAAGTYTIGANLTNPAAASNYSMTINSGTLTTRPVVVPTPAKEDKPFVNPVAPKPVTPAESGSKSQVSSSTTAQAVDVKLAAVEKPSVAEQCSATDGRSEKCDCQKTLFDEVLLCKVPLEGAGQPAHATQKAKAHSNFN